jgi:exosortase family protein XrtG
MTNSLLAALLGIYLIGLLALRRMRFGLIGYVWGAFGLAALFILASQIGQWNLPLGSLEANIVVALANALGMHLAFLDPASLIVPDPTGWSIMRIGVECSTLIEAAVFGGLMMFYPRFPPGERLVRLTAGLGATFLINLARLSVIVGMVTTMGKPAVPWAHAVVGRLVFFIGVVTVYWRMMTLPTLRMVRRDLEVSGRAVR